MAVTTVYSVPDDGRKGLPKHVELLTPNKEHKKLQLVGIYMISVYRYLVVKPEIKRPFGVPRRRWEGNIRIDFKRIGMRSMN